MGLITAGWLNKEIASTLGTTEKTIKAHRAHVMRKMQAGSIAALVRMVALLETGAPPPAPLQPIRGVTVAPGAGPFSPCVVKAACRNVENTVRYIT